MTLLGWLRDRGAELGPVEVQGEGRTRGVHTTAALPAGALVARIPATVILCNDTAARLPIARFVGADPAEGFLLTLAVLGLRGDPAWAPYIDDLPTRVEGHPTGWSAAVRQAIRGTTIALLLPDLEERLRTEVATLRAAGFAVSWATWCTARNVVTSRRFSHRSDSALVPFGDLLNHALDPEVDWDWDDGDFVLTTRRAVPAGAELRCTYGDKPNTRLMLSYGFALPDNPHDDVPLPLPGDDVVFLPRVDSKQARKAWQTLGLDDETRRRARLADLRARRDALPSGEGLPADARYVVEGERAVYSGWISRLAR